MWSIVAVLAPVITVAVIALVIIRYGWPPPGERGDAEV